MRYTENEDAIIIEFLKEDPLNIQRALKAAAKLLHRSYSSTCQRYYSKLRHTKVIFSITVDNKIVSSNYKNDPVFQKKR